MKVLHLSTSDVRGGAARGAYFLHRKLRQQGVESQMLVGRKHSDDENVMQLRGMLAPLSERLRSRFDTLPLRHYDKTDESFWTVGWQPRDLGGAVAAHRPDIVHVQWTGGGFLPVEALRQIRAPIVWTLRDMWAFTGGCHYTGGCTGYVTGCGHCPQLRSDRCDDLSHTMLERKRRAWRGLDLWLVPISAWMAERARESRLLGDAPISVIPNGIDSTCFRPMDKGEARRRLGLPEDRRFVMFSALHALTDTRKGFWHLRDALRLIRDEGLGAVPELLVAGADEPGQATDFGTQARFFGQVDEDERLAMLYAAADVVAAPSLQEAFGKVHVEAMSCGTAVVAFDSGGPREIVQHRRTGYLARPFEVEDLARGILWCLEKAEKAPEIGWAARDHAAARYDMAVVARQYLDHYETVLRQAA